MHSYSVKACLWNVPEGYSGHPPRGWTPHSAPGCASKEEGPDIQLYIIIGLAA